MTAWYTTLEDVRASTSSATTALDDVAVCEMIEAGAESINAELGYPAGLAPTYATRSFDYPDREAVGRPSYLVRFEGQGPLIELTTASAGGTDLAVGDLLLDPHNYGPPYRSVAVDLSTTTALRSGTTWQRALLLTGLWGWTDAAVAAGSLAAVMSDSTTTTVTVTNGAAAGIGSLLRVGDERMTVTGRALASTGETGTLTASAAARSLAVADGTAYAVNELLTLDSERVRITAIGGNTLIVERAVDGTVLAAHTAATIYASRLLTVVRGAHGSTAASHANGTALTRWVPPAGLARLNRAMAVAGQASLAGAYARPARGGAGASARPAAGSIEDLYQAAMRTYGRQARKGAV